MKRLTYQFSGVGEDFGPRSDGLVTGHTWENGAHALTVADAMSGLKWQDGDDVPGSYNDVICIDGIVSSVPAHHASGGINPGSKFWAPKPWLFDLMSREMVNNPNYFTRNIVFLGRRASHDANGWPPAMIDNFVTIVLEEEKRIGRQVVLTQHGDFQTNRSDAGDIAHKLIQQRYLERTGKHMKLKYTPGLFRTTAEAECREMPATSSPVVARIPKGSPVFVIGDTFDQAGWFRLGIVGSDPERLLFLRSSQLELVSNKIYDPIATVVNNVLAGRPALPQGETVEVIKEVPTGLTQQDLQKAVSAERERIATAEANRIRKT